MSDEIWEESDLFKAQYRKSWAGKAETFLRGIIRYAKAAREVPDFRTRFDARVSEGDMVGEVLLQASDFLDQGMGDEEMVKELDAHVMRNRDRYQREGDAAFSRAVQEDLVAGGPQIRGVLGVVQRRIDREARGN